MTLLKKQTAASPFRGLPVSEKTSASTLTSVTGEVVQLQYYSAGVLTNDAGQAIGVAVVGQLAYDKVKNALGNMQATVNDTSLSFTSTALTTEKAINETIMEGVDESAGATRLNAIVAPLNNGEYVVDYANGTIYGKKASTTATLTSTAYKYRATSSATTSGTGASATQVQGTAAEAATAVGNPVRVGGVYELSPTTLTNGQQGTLQEDANQNLRVAEQFAPKYEDNTNSVAAIAIKPLGVSTYTWTLFTNLGANATLNVKASTGNVKSLYCHNLNGAARYIQIHNTATTPAGGATPIFTFLVPAGGTAVLDGQFFGENGYNFATGIAFAFSTTEATYTAGTAADQITHILYA